MSGFIDCQETILFMKRFIKWFEIHDSCNLTQSIMKRLPNKAPFTSENDERSKWLEAFKKWLIAWKESCVIENEFLTRETYEALLLTTESTIPKIRYMLKDFKFQFVLTRKFNSDNIERKFSALRQVNGGNYNMDAKAAIYGVEKLLRTGICYTALDCNAPLQREKRNRTNQEMIRPTSENSTKKRASDVLRSLTKEDRSPLDDRYTETAMLI